MSESARFDAIPTELRARDQWLMWDSAADTPRRPHWRGDFSVSWSDPDDWHSFEEAVEAAKERESWGIGYVFAKGNDEYPRGIYGALDLDGCVSDDGTPKDWLPGLKPFFDEDAYIEFSPSGEGIHIPLAGFEVPGWWTDVALEEHEGVEAYEKKFFTFTGDTLRGAGDSVADTGDYVEKWLKAVYENIAGERPWEVTDNSGGERVPTGPTTAASTGNTDDIIDDLDHLDARDVAEQTIVSSWNDDAGTSGDNRAFYPTWGPNCNGTANICDRDGWVDTGTDSGSGGPVVMAAIDALGHSHSGISRGDVRGSDWWDAVDHLRDLGFGIAEYEGEVPADTTVEKPEAGDEGELPTPDGFAVAEGSYGSWYQVETDDGVVDRFNEWTNFQIEVRSFVFDESGDPRLNLRIWPTADENPYEVTVSPTVFNEKRDFKAQICSGLTTTFSGGEQELNAIRRFVGQQSAPSRQGTRHMGLHGDEWVTPVGSLTSDSWAEEPEMVYLDRGIGVERKWSVEPGEYEEIDRDAVRDMVRLLPKTRSSDRFIPTLGWFYAAPLRPLIHGWTGEFNIHGVLGETGSGKTTTLSTLWSMFGMARDPLTVDDTKFVLTATLGSTNSIPMWFDEYKPSDMKDYEVDRFWNLVRKVTRGGVASRGNADKSTEEFHLHAPTVVSGEERVSGSAEERRGIYTTYRKEVTEAGSESARAFAQLTGGDWSAPKGEREYYEGYDLSEHAVAYYQFVLGRDQDQLREQWREAGESVGQLLASQGIDGLGDLVKQGLQTVKFGARLYRQFAQDLGSDDEILSPEAVDDAILYVATESVGGINRQSHLDAFFEVAARAAKHGYLEEGEHYAVVREGKPNEELRINLPTAFDKITRYAREHDVSEDILNSYQDYRERIKDDLNGDGYLVTYSQPTNDLGRCIGLDMAAAANALDNFGKSMFVNVSINGDDESIVTTGLRDLDPGYTDATAIVASLSQDLPERGPAFSAVLQDRSGVVDAVCWDDDGFLDRLEENQAYLLKKAKVGFNSDGALQLEFVPGVTHLQEIEPGVGTIPSAGVGDGQGQLSAQADGGVVVSDDIDDARKSVLNELQRVDTSLTVSALAGRLGRDPDTIEATVKRLSRGGQVITEGDEIRYNG